MRNELVTKLEAAEPGRLMQTALERSQQRKENKSMNRGLNRAQKLCE